MERPNAFNYSKMFESFLDTKPPSNQEQIDNRNNQLYAFQREQMQYPQENPLNLHHQTEHSSSTQYSQENPLNLHQADQRAAVPASSTTACDQINSKTMDKFLNYSMQKVPYANDPKDPMLAKSLAQQQLDRLLGQKRPHQFNYDHMHIKEFQSWLKPVVGDPFKAYCSLCNTQMTTCTTSSYSKHLESKKHRDVLLGVSGSAPAVPGQVDPNQKQPINLDPRTQSVITGNNPNEGGFNNETQAITSTSAVNPFMTPQAQQPENKQDVKPITFPGQVTERPGEYVLKDESHCSTLLRRLLHDKSYADVSLTSGGKTIQAHKLVLIQSSNYFKRVLSSDTSPRTVFVFKDVPWEDLRHLVCFMYIGEVTVPESQLESFMNTAEDLEVTALCDIDATKKNNPKSFSTHTFIPDIQIKKEMPSIEKMMKIEVEKEKEKEDAKKDKDEGKKEKKDKEKEKEKEKEKTIVVSSPSKVGGLLSKKFTIKKKKEGSSSEESGDNDPDYNPHGGGSRTRHRRSSSKSGSKFDINEYIKKRKLELSSNEEVNSQIDMTIKYVNETLGKKKKGSSVDEKVAEISAKALEKAKKNAEERAKVSSSTSEENAKSWTSYVRKLDDKEIKKNVENSIKNKADKDVSSTSKESKKNSKESKEKKDSESEEEEEEEEEEEPKAKEEKAKSKKTGDDDDVCEVEEDPLKLCEEDIIALRNQSLSFGKGTNGVEGEGGSPSSQKSDGSKKKSSSGDGQPKAKVQKTKHYDEDR